MSADWVLDTSVAIAWYLPESFQPAARVWQRRMLDDEIRLWVPGLHYWETANVLRTLVRRREIARSMAEEIYRLHMEAPLQVAEPAADAVLETALTLDATAYDAVVISLAHRLGARLLTAESRTRHWVAQLGDRVEHVS